jgi:hypothetical protein
VFPQCDNISPKAYSSSRKGLLEISEILSISIMPQQIDDIEMGVQRFPPDNNQEE